MWNREIETIGRAELAKLQFERLKKSLEAAAKAFAAAENGVILFGSEGTSLETSQALAQACANLLITTNHVGRPNNGLIGSGNAPTSRAPGISAFVQCQTWRKR